MRIPMSANDPKRTFRTRRSHMSFRPLSDGSGPFLMYNTGVFLMGGHARMFKGEAR